MNVKQGTWYSVGNEVRHLGTKNCMCKGPESVWLKSWKRIHGDDLQLSLQDVRNSLNSQEPP